MKPFIRILMSDGNQVLIFTHHITYITLDAPNDKANIHVNSGQNVAIATNFSMEEILKIIEG